MRTFFHRSTLHTWLLKMQTLASLWQWQFFRIYVQHIENLECESEVPKRITIQLLKVYSSMVKFGVDVCKVTVLLGLMSYFQDISSTLKVAMS